MWNFALDGNGNPKLPGTDSCGTPCRPVVTINSDGSYSYNQECTSSSSSSSAPPLRFGFANGPIHRAVHCQST